jgi:rare lipoprotein A
MIKKILFSVTLCLIIISCASKVQKEPPHSVKHGVKYARPYVINGVKYYPMKSVKEFQQKGIASWYGKKWHGRLTANGERYDMYAMTAAHKTLPLGSYVHVKNLDNGREAVVRINDRGPYVRGRIIDMSYSGAKKLGIVDVGTAHVKLTLLSEKKDRLVIKGKEVDPDKGNFSVQIASFTNYDNAMKMKNKYSKAKVFSTYSNGRKLYRVKITGFKSRHSAERYAKNIKNEFPGAFITAE